MFFRKGGRFEMGPYAHFSLMLSPMAVLAALRMQHGPIQRDEERTRTRCRRHRLPRWGFLNCQLFLRFGPRSHGFGHPADHFTIDYQAQRLRHDIRDLIEG